MLPTTGVGLQGADGTSLTCKYVDTADGIPFLPPPSEGPVIAKVTTILYKGLQFCTIAASSSHSHTQNNAFNTAESTGPLGGGAHGGSSSTPAGILPPSGHGQPVATTGRLSRAHGNPSGRPTHILLCNQPTIDIICNPDLLTSI